MEYLTVSVLNTRTAVRVLFLFQMAASPKASRFVANSGGLSIFRLFIIYGTFPIPQIRAHAFVFYYLLVYVRKCYAASRLVYFGWPCWFQSIFQPTPF